MKVTDAATVMTAAALELSTMPREMATAIHSASARTHANDVKEATWSDLRSNVTDPDDLPSLDAPVQALKDAIAAIRAAWPRA